MKLELPRVTARTPISDKPPSLAFSRFWDQFARSIETAFNGTAALNDDVAALKSGVAMRDADNEFTATNIFDDLPDSKQGYRVAETQVVGPQDTGWTDGTGTPLKGAFAAYAGQTVGGSYSQAEVQAIDDAAAASSQRLLAIEQALKAHGLIGA